MNLGVGFAIQVWRSGTGTQNMDRNCIEPATKFIAEREQNKGT